LSFEDERRALIKISQFILNRETDEVRDDVCKSLIEMALFIGYPRLMTLSDIIETLSKEYRIRRFYDTILKAHLQELTEAGRIIQRDNEFSLSDAKHKKISQDIEYRSKLSANVLNKLIEFAREKNPLLEDSDEKDLVDNFQSFLASFFTSNATVAADILLREKGRVQMPEEDIKTTLDKMLKHLREDLREIQRYAITKLLGSGEPDVDHYISRTMENYVFFQVLNLDPECRLIERRALSNLKLFLDTNVVLDLLLPSEPRHNFAKELVKLANTLRVRMVVTSRTEKEFIEHIRSESDAYRRWIERVPKKVLRTISAYERGLIQSYFSEEERTPSLTFDGYCYTLEKGLEKILKDKFSIELDETNYDEIYIHEDFKEFYTSVDRCAQKWNILKEEPVLIHDAFHLLLVRELRRREGGTTLFGPKYWFVTHDNSLYCVSRSHDESPALSVRGDIWLNAMSTILPLGIYEREMETLENAFGDFCSASLTMLYPKLDLHKLYVISGPWMGFDWLTTEDIADVASSKFVRDYLEEYERTVSEGGSPGPSTEAVSQALNQVILEKIRKLEKELAGLRQNALRTTEERDRLESQIVGLKNRLSGIEQDREKVLRERQAQEGQLNRFRSKLGIYKAFVFILAAALVAISDLYFYNLSTFSSDVLLWIIGIEVALFLGVPSIWAIIRWTRSTESVGE